MKPEEIEAENKLLRKLLYELLCRVDKHGSVVTNVHEKEWGNWLKKARLAAMRE